MSPNYTIIDAHAHIFPEKIAKKATDAIGNFYDIPMKNPAGLAQKLVSEGSKIDVKRYLVSSAATTPAQVHSINDFIYESTCLYPEFYGFGTLHPMMEDAEREIDRIIALGLHGIKFHPDFQTFNIDAPEAIKLYKRLADVGLPVLFHTGDDRYDYSAPSRLQRVMEQVDGLVAIAAHFGGYNRWDEASIVLNHPNIYFDTSSTLFKMDTSTAKDLIHHFGANRFMFGTDFPMWNHIEELKRFMAIDLSEDERRQIFSGTFCELFHLS